MVEAKRELGIYESLVKALVKHITVQVYPMQVLNI